MNSYRRIRFLQVDTYANGQTDGQTATAAAATAESQGQGKCQRSADGIAARIAGIATSTLDAF